jgi:hypothetical protein
LGCASPDGGGGQNARGWLLGSATVKAYDGSANVSAESTTLPEVPSAHFPVKQQLATGDWVVPAAKQAQLGYIVAVAGYTFQRDAEKKRCFADGSISA